jgi:hypothetical protein
MKGLWQMPKDILLTKGIAEHSLNFKRIARVVKSRDAKQY